MSGVDVEADTFSLRDLLVKYGFLPAVNPAPVVVDGVLLDFSGSMISEEECERRIEASHRILPELRDPTLRAAIINLLREHDSRASGVSRWSR
jgi:hypothetical protein